MIHFTSRQIVSDLVQSCHQITLSHFKTYRINCHFYESFHFMTIHSTCVVFLVVTAAHIISLRSRRYSRAQGEKLEIPPAQKLSILSSAHRAHGSAHINVFALENQSERELLIMLLAGLQCSKRCQFNNCFVFFCHGEQNNSHEIFVKAYTVNIVHFPTPVDKIAITSLPRNKCWIDILCSYFESMGRPIADK